MTLPQRFPQSMASAPDTRSTDSTRPDQQRPQPSGFTKVIPNPWIERSRERAWLGHLPDFAMQLSRSVRAGTSFEQALVDAVAGADVPTRVQVASARVAAGQPIVGVIDSWGDQARSEPERLLVAALAVGLGVGAQMGPVLDGIAMALRDELALDARRRVLLVQAQVSALVLVVMPLGFAALSSIIRGGFAFAGITGLLLLVGGLTLDGVGVLWMRRLLRGLR